MGALQQMLMAGVVNTPAADYVKWNSADKNEYVNLTNGDLTADCSNSGGGIYAFPAVRGNIGFNTGKRVFEILVARPVDTSGQTKTAEFGIGNAVMTLTSPFLSGDSSGIHENILPITGVANGSYVESNMAHTGLVTATVVPVAFMFAVDFDGGKMWIATGNVWMRGDPAAGTLPSVTFTPGTTLYPVGAPGSQTNASVDVVITPTVTINGGQSAFVNTVPAGWLTPDWSN